MKNKMADSDVDNCTVYNGIIKAGNYNLVVENGLIVDCKVAKDRYIKQGTYKNAAVCVDEDGCITEIAEGNPLRTGTTCQSCGSDW